MSATKMEEGENFSYGVKSAFAQCLALSGVCFLEIGIGAQAMIPTIVIGPLKENSTIQDENEFLIMTSEEASWFGSLMYLFVPLGSLLSSLLLDRLGHKMCMILTNVPFLAAQIMLFFAENVQTLYVSSILIALGTGFSIAPCFAYTGEVAEPKLRGSLTSTVCVFYYVGSIALTAMYSINMRWRTTILMSTFFPIITIFILFMIPESPVWLLSKGKNAKAYRTLNRLRGNASHDETCASEFQEMVTYATSVNKSAPGDKDDVNDIAVWRQLLEPEVLRPFRLIMICFFFETLLSGIAFSPYLVEIYTKFNAPVNVEWTITFSMGMSILGCIMSVLLMPTLGKRFLLLFTLLMCSICYILIGLIGIYWENSRSSSSWAILILYLTTILMASFGITPVGWTLVSEIFPAKSRNITCSISSAFFYTITFFMTKYYQDFSILVNFYNVFTIYGVCGLFGCVFFYFYLPETENKTLQEISEFFK